MGGWQQGKGLGKQEQGMLNPLITKKAAGSATTGIIVESQLTNPDLESLEKSQKTSNVLVISRLEREMKQPVVDVLQKCGEIKEMFALDENKYFVHFA